MSYQFDEVIRRLGPAGITDLFRSVGGRLAKPEPDARGFIQCHSLYKPDDNPSAAINVNTGIYVDFTMSSSESNLFTKPLCHWLGDKGPYADWKHAYQDLCQKLGIKENGRRSRQKALGDLVATYDYHNETGALVFQVCKFIKDGKKTFRQRRPDGKGGHHYSLDGVERVPYRLQELLASDGVFLTEGEKDADNLAKATGLAASCNPGGAGNWATGLNKYFAGKKVIILPDNDDPGRRHAQVVAHQLHGVAALIKIIELPGLPDKGDVTDWLDAGGTRERLLQIVKDTEPWQPPPDSSDTLGPSLPGSALPDGFRTKEQVIFGYNLTDIGNGQRLIHMFGQNLHYCFPRKSWFCWDGKRWALDTRGTVEHMAKEAVMAMYPQAATLENGDQRQELLAHAKRSENDQKRKSLIISARSEPGIPILPAELDSHFWLFNANNGTIDLQTGQLRPHRREDLITKVSPVNYDPQATCPVWESFLWKIFNEDMDLINFVQQVLGYALTGDTSEQCMFILHGAGQNGKSTLINAFKYILNDYALETPSQTLMTNKNDGISNDLARLDGPRFVSSRETDLGKHLAESLIKALTGQDEVAARYLYGEYFDFRPQFKLFLATNHRPVIRGTDKGIWRRMHLIPFEVQISDEEKDEGLPQKLIQEAAGILNWAVLGCLDWQENGLQVPDRVKAATGKYRREMDDLAEFFEERCILAPEVNVLKGDLYDAYLKWAGENKAMSKKAFSLTLFERGFKDARVGKESKRIWEGTILSG